MALSLLVSLVLVLGWSQTAQAQAEPPNAVTVQLDAPSQVAPGQLIRLTLRLQAPAPAAGFEAELRYDPAAAQFAGFYPALPQAAGVGRLSLIDMPFGSVVGAYACATDPCLAQRELQAQAAASTVTAGTVADDSTILAVVELLPLQPGALALSLDHVRLVDAAGRPLPVNLAASSFTVQVGEAGETFAAPASLRNDAAVAAAQAEVSAAMADVTQDGAVSHADVMEVALAWQVSREEGAVCGLDSAQVPDPRVDVNGDGCVDVADVQLAAAYAAGPDSAANAPAETETAETETTEVAATPSATGTVTLTVNSTLDEADATAGDGVCETASGECTLRAALQEANAQTGPNTILFNIPGGGVHTIQLTSRLPTLRDESGPTLIDGYSQPGASPNSDPLISNATILIEVRGSGSESFDALAITSAGNTIRGLAIYNAKRPLWIYGAGAHDNVIVGNFIGTDAAGTFHLTVTSPRQAHGIHVEQGSHNNQIGGAEPAQRNVVGGNARHGIGFWHVGTEQNLVLNNLVGLSPDGKRSLPNHGHGIDFNLGAARNTVGGTEEGERNVVSGNMETGVEISHGNKTTQNRVIGNYIGTDVSGDAGPTYAANGELGVMMKDRVRDNLVSGNVIGNNGIGGVSVDEFGNCCVSGNVVEANRIGIGVNDGLIPNQEYGVRVLASQTRIGPANVIANNPVGVQVEGNTSLSNTITQNSIFANVGLGIDLAPFDQVNLNDDGDADDGPNAKLNFPVLESVAPNQATGTACADCRVEVFIADASPFNHGQGRTFVGAAVAGPDGKFTATLDNVPLGQYLTATATDQGGNTSEFSQNVLLSDPSNQPPTAVDDEAMTLSGRSVIIDVLGNDTDPEGDALSVESVDQPQHGTTTSNGAFVVYEPEPDFAGVDQFTYTASDGVGGSSTATVRVTTEDLNISGDVVVTPTQISLVDGEPASYSLALGSEPSAPVTVTVITDGRITAEPAQLVFNTTNWDKLQTITISINQVAAVSEEETTATESIIYHLAHSADQKYNNLGLPTVTVQIGEVKITVFLPMISKQQ